MMAKEDFAALLNSKKYPFGLTAEEKEQAKAAGLIVVFGASNYLMKFDGAICDEAGGSDDFAVRIDAKGILPSFSEVHRDSDEEKMASFFERRKKAHFMMPPDGSEECTYREHGMCLCPHAKSAALESLRNRLTKELKQLEEDSEG